MSDWFKNFSGWIEKEKSLDSVVAYKIGGRAKYFAIPKREDDIAEILRIGKDYSVPVFVVGSGTNLLVSDEGYDGIILWVGPHERMRTSVYKVTEDEQEITIRVPSYFGKAQLLDYALKNNLSGLEFSAGIPGSLGGAVYMNAGTKWGSYGDVIVDVEFVSIERGKFKLSNSEIGFKYRGLGENIITPGTVVAAVSLKLKKMQSMKKVFDTVDEIYSYRGLRQPLELPNCGSVFKNPANSEKGAGRLIEACGLKGLAHGGAEISQKHANFILNTGNAKADDVKYLIAKIQEVVFEKFNIELEPEVVIL